MINELVTKAKELAIRAHWSQMYGSVPYIQHLDEVYDVINTYCSCTLDNRTLGELRVGAYLHDIIEDTYVSRKILEREFGYEISCLVYAVTDETGVNRRERKAKTYPKILCHPEAIYLKLADRIANLQHSLTAKDTKMIDMYRKEDKEFRERLQTNDIAVNLWAKYDSLITPNLGQNSL